MQWVRIQRKIVSSCGFWFVFLPVHKSAQFFAIIFPAPFNIFQNYWWVSLKMPTFVTAVVPLYSFATHCVVLSRCV